MDTKRKDILVYTLFFAIILMFIILFFFFFRPGNSQITEHTQEIPKGITTIILTSNLSDINFLPTDSATPYISYTRRTSQSTTDDVSFTQNNDEYHVSVERKSNNTLSGMWKKSAPITIYLPKTSALKFSLKIDAGSVHATNVVMQSLSLNSTAAILNVNRAKMDKLNFVSTMGDFTVDSCMISSISTQVNVGKINLLGQDASGGFALDCSLSLGYIDAASELGVNNPSYAIKYKDKLAYSNAACKIKLYSNLAIVKIRK